MESKVNMTTEIRNVDFFESVMEHPHLYTLLGSYAEAIAFIDGCSVSYEKLAPKIGVTTHYFFVDIRIYQAFKAWLADRYNMESKDALRTIGEGGNDAYTLILQLYQEFKLTITST